ncbi:hypothetical protein MUK42_03656 [Musa troglodytarum]|uniref:Uncharacterized protein n=1 Tax=Musa troglodytarum TaxID=320322 RepID=A0A9E7HHI5_9LILI|nr:hypothetical protein MUK42_03656 [Musa troglodytarum]
MQGPGAGDVWAWPPWWPRPLRQGAPLVPVPALLFSAVRLDSGGPVGRSSQRQEVRRSPRSLARSILRHALAARSRRPALYSGDSRLPLYCCFYFCCVLALYVYALCCGSDAATPPSF